MKPQTRQTKRTEKGELKELIKDQTQVGTKLYARGMTENQTSTAQSDDQMLSSKSRGSQSPKKFGSQNSKEESQIFANHQVNVKIIIKPLLPDDKKQDQPSDANYETRINNPVIPQQNYPIASEDSKPKRRLKGLKKNLSLAPYQLEQQPLNNQEQKIPDAKALSAIDGDITATDSKAKDQKNDASCHSSSKSTRSNGHSPHNEQQSSHSMSPTETSNPNFKSALPQMCGQKRLIKNRKKDHLHQLTVDLNDILEDHDPNLKQLISSNTQPVESVDASQVSLKETPLPTKGLEGVSGVGTRSSRQRKCSMNYSVFFEDFDSLSEKEENKRKREQKKSQKNKKLLADDPILTQVSMSNANQKKDAIQQNLVNTKSFDTLNQSSLNQNRKSKSDVKAFAGIKNDSQQIIKRNNIKSVKIQIKKLNSKPLNIQQNPDEKVTKDMLTKGKSQSMIPKIRGKKNESNNCEMKDQALSKDELFQNEAICLVLQNPALNIFSIQDFQEQSEYNKQSSKLIKISNSQPTKSSHPSTAKSPSQPIDEQDKPEKFPNGIKQRNLMKKAKEEDKANEADDESCDEKDFKTINSQSVKKRVQKRQTKATKEKEANELQFNPISLKLNPDQVQKKVELQPDNQEKTQVDQVTKLQSLSKDANDGSKSQSEEVKTNAATLFEEPERKEFCMMPLSNKGQSIKNEFDRNIRAQALCFIDFNNLATENNTYRPALIQKEQQDPNKIATHFIHKKQSQCNIKRISGVSYIKKSESKQLNVRDRYEKLAPIVIQGSYQLPRLEDPIKVQLIEKICDQTFFSENSYLVCTAFESANEVSMKNYILKPHKRLQICKNNIWVVKSEGLADCWRFVKDKYFFCVHFMYDKDQMLRNIDPNDLNDLQKIQEFIQKSDVCLGILTKRGNASIKSMLKVYKLEDEFNDYLKRLATCSEESKVNSLSQSQSDKLDIASRLGCKGATIQGINTIALMMRIELYVDEIRWKSLDLQSKQMLNSLINICEEKSVPTLFHWNDKRTKVINGFLPENKNVYKIKAKDQFNKFYERRQPEKWESLELKEESQSTQIVIELSPELYEKDSNTNDILSQLKNSFPIPLTLINTRDCFVYDLFIKVTQLNMGKGRENVIKREFYFNPGNVPENYRSVVGLSKDADMEDVENFRVGVTTYENFYTDEELKNMEGCIEDTEKKSLDNRFLPMTAQKTFSGNTLKRTKFFFGYRYMWTRTQLLEPLSNVAAGVRADVSQAPVWTKTVLEEPLVNAGIIEKDFINSVALNVYHDGSEGLAQHFDDATRFKQPIYTIRLFSDSRLSFGSQYYGFCNGAFFCPLPRGCICVMEEGSYSANGVKHCIRPCDMTGKSSAVILRQMHPNVVNEAVKYDRNVDLPMWMSSLSLEDDSTAYYQQKELECLAIEYSQQ